MPRFEFVSAGSPRHAEDCAQLEERDGHVPWLHGAARARAYTRPHDLWCRVCSAQGTLEAGVVVTVDRSRKLPWVRLARVEQATSLLAALDADGVRAFSDAVATAIPHLASLVVQAYAVRDAEGTEQRERLVAAGFVREPMARGYEHTLVLPLDGDDAALSSRLSASARRNLRQVAASGYATQSVTDERYAPRLAELLAASHERSGGRAGAADGVAMLRAAAADPTSSVVLGTFHPAREGPAALVGFAQGTLAPDAAVYAVAGTERSPEVGRTPLSYGLLWELLVWGRQRDVSWFDFGGVTAQEDEGNPLAGISAFKRKFGGLDCEIAAEYRLVTNPLQHRLLDLSAGAVQRLRGSG